LAVVISYHKPTSVNIIPQKNQKSTLKEKKYDLLHTNKGWYNSLTKPSGIDPYVHKRTKYRKPIKESKMIKTNSHLNKWDMKKISHLK
jgi:hypothetical protein